MARREVSAEVTDGGMAPYHVWIVVDGTRTWGRFCRSREEAERYMDVAQVPAGRREWKA